MSSFRVETVLATKESVDQETTWTALEGRVFGLEGHYPLKIFIGTGGDKWQPAWQSGCQKYAKRLKTRKRKAEFAEECMNPAIMPQAALSMANRRGIERSGCLKKVSWRGPEFKSESDLDDWISGKSEYLIDEDPCDVPDDIRRLYVFDDGIWRVQVTTEPPEEWLATAEQIGQLLEVDVFNDQVGGARRVLEEDGGDLEDEGDLKNSGSGPAPKRRGTPSRKKSEQA